MRKAVLCLAIIFTAAPALAEPVTCNRSSCSVKIRPW
jgi:hypothetical protein